MCWSPGQTYTTRPYEFKYVLKKFLYHTSQYCARITTTDVRFIVANNVYDRYRYNSEDTEDLVKVIPAAVAWPDSLDVDIQVNYVV